MEEILSDLLNKHQPQDVIHACNTAARIIKSQSAQDLSQNRFANTESFANCFMSVLLSNFGNQAVLSSATKALIELVKAYPHLKEQYGSNGMYFNIMDIFRIHKENFYDNEESVYLTCALELCVALTDQCSANLQCCNEADVLSVVSYTFKTTCKDIEVMFLCLKFLSSLISPVLARDEEKLHITKLQDQWCSQCLENNIDEEPLTTCILIVMNRYLGQSPGIQLYGIKCLRALMCCDKVDLLDYGVIDSLVHTCLHHIDGFNILIEALEFLEQLLQNATQTEIASKSDGLCDLATEILKRYMSIETVISRTCQVIKAFLLIDVSLCFVLVEKNVPSLLFYGLFLHLRSLETAGKNQSICSSLVECLHLLLADSWSNVSSSGVKHTKSYKILVDVSRDCATSLHQNEKRTEKINDLLTKACGSGAVNETLLLLYLGGDINYITKDGSSPLAEACKQQDSNMVKHIISYVVFLNETCDPQIRLEHITKCMYICQEAGSDGKEIVPFLLWYLLYQNKNGIANWNNLGLAKLDDAWICQLFSLMMTEGQSCNISKRLPKPASAKAAEMIIKAGDSIHNSIVPGDERNNGSSTNWGGRFSFFLQSNIPILQLQTFNWESTNDTTQIFELPEGENLCLRCSASMTFRDVLHLSFDENTLMEERLHPPINDKCTCFVNFPPCFTPSVGIEELQLSCNELSSLSSFETLPQRALTGLSNSLKKVKLTSNSITCIPLHVAKVFCNICELDLSSNKLSWFPFELLLSCPKLESLDLSDNLMENNFTDDHVLERWSPGSLTASLKQSSPVCPSLQTLTELSHNLKTLNISKNGIKHFPCWIFQLLPNLFHLEMKQNFLTDVPAGSILGEFIVGLPDLKLLDLSQNKFSQFSCDFLKLMPKIQHLDLSKNLIQVMECEDCSSQPSCIQYLDISDNHLSQIPTVVLFLTKLQTLNLSGNHIKQLPNPVQWKADQLVWLDVSKNQLTTISFVASLASIFTVKSIKTLNFSNNHISELPPELGSLSSLEVLDVSFNKLNTLPDELGLLSNLQKLCIKGNKLSMNLSLLEDQPQELCAFLYARLKKSVVHNRVKIMLLGHAEAGKTTMLQSLINHKSSRLRKFSSGLFPKVLEKTEKSQTALATIGIDVVEWTVNYRNKVFLASTWDFGGQEDFYATHPCFLSERAMFIVVYDGSKGPQQLRTLRPWLTAIHSRAPHCPVLIVATHADMMSRDNLDEHSKSLRNELNLLSRNKWFPKGSSNAEILHEFLDVRDGSQSIAYLKSLIGKTIAESIVQGDPLVCEMVPYSYVQLEDALKKEAGSRNAFPVIRNGFHDILYIIIALAICPNFDERVGTASINVLELSKEFEDTVMVEDTAICFSSFNQMVGLLQKSGSNQSSPFDSGSELMMAVKFLHQTGVLLHFSDPRSGLHDCFFIKPAWLCQLLAQVICMREQANYKTSPYIGANGILSKAQLTENLISGGMIPKDFASRLFRLLENFEVIMWQGGDEYLVPSKLPVESPTLELPVKSSEDVVIRYFSLIYIPMGFWPRFIARLLSFSTTFVTGYKSGARKLAPSRTETWRCGLYMEWSGLHETVFILIQSGCTEFCRVTENASPPDKSDLNNDQREGMEIVLPRNETAKILSGQLVDHFNNLIEEWFPGLLEQDVFGNPFIMQYSPCPVCVENKSTVHPIHSFCVSDVSDSMLYYTTSDSKYKELLNASYEIEHSSSGELFVRCPNHVDQLVPVAEVASDITLTDYDAELHLVPSLLKFEPTPNNLLGNGGFGSVYQAVYKGEGVAVKTFHVSSSESTIKMIRAELQVLAQHRHPSIISLVGFVPPATFAPSLPLLPILALEFAKFGSLGALLTNMTEMKAEARKLALPVIVRHRIMYELADGLAFLHSRHIVYRDLKPDNVLLVSLDPASPTISKITDYGISTLASPSGIPSPCGSPGYSAPEVVSLKIRDKQQSRDLFPYSVKCDVYSYGLLLHEVAVGRSPWIDYVCEEHNSKAGPALSPCQPDDVILEGVLPSPIRSYQGAIAWPHAQNLVTRCLRRNPDERPTAAHIVKVLEDSDSCCLRSTEHLSDSVVDWLAVTQNRSSSCSDSGLGTSDETTDLSGSDSENQTNTCDLSILWMPSVKNPRNASVHRIEEAKFNTKSCRVVQESVYFNVDEKFVVTCLLLMEHNLLGTSHEACQNKAGYTIIAGTSQGYLVRFVDEKTHIQSKLGASVACLHFHNPEGETRSGVSPTFVLAGLDDFSIACFGTDTLFGSACCPTHILALKEIACHRPVLTMASLASSVHAGCGNFMVSFTLGDSGGPTVCSVKSVHMEDDRGSSDICELVTGKNAIYSRMRKSSIVCFWQTGNPQRNRIDVAHSIDKDQNHRHVTSLFVDHSHSSLWIGLSSGHVMLFDEPLKAHVIKSDSKPLAVLQPFTGPVSRILKAPVRRSTDVVNIEDLTFCLGWGQRPLLEDDNSGKFDSTIQTDNSSQDCVSSSNSDRYLLQMDRMGFYLMVFDADLASTSSLFDSAKKARAQWRV